MISNTLSARGVAGLLKFKLLPQMDSAPRMKKKPAAPGGKEQAGALSADEGSAARGF